MITPKNQQFSLLLLLVLFLGSCDNELTLQAPGEETVIVYGMLAAGDTAHYLRVDRAFRTQGSDATEIAQQPAALYFDEVSVMLENQQTGQQFPLERVAGAAEGYPRQEGPFAQAPNYLYKIDEGTIGLTGGEELRLLVDRGEAFSLTTATTTILEPLEASLNSPFSPVNMAYDRQVRFAWSHGPAAGLFQARLRIQIREEVTPGAWEDRTLYWVLDEALLPEESSNRSSVTVLGEQFYRFLANTLEEEAGLSRQFMGMALEVLAGGRELAEARQLAQANTGLTAAQFVPEYTNISDGLGVFSSRAQLQRTGLQLTGPSLDSLRNGRYTQDLNFQ